MNPDNDQQLRQLFRQQREADLARVPAFSRLTRAPEVPAWPWLRFAAVAAACVVLGVSVTMWRRLPQSPAVNTESWTALSNWQASTDVLLAVSSAPWGGTITTPSDSWFETSTPTEQKETTL